MCDGVLPSVIVDFALLGASNLTERSDPWSNLFPLPGEPGVSCVHTHGENPVFWEGKFEATCVGILTQSFITSNVQMQTQISTDCDSTEELLGANPLCVAFRGAVASGICAGMAASAGTALDCSKLNLTSITVTPTGNTTRRQLFEKVGSERLARQLDRFDDTLATSETYHGEHYERHVRRLAAVAATLDIEYQLEVESEEQANSIAEIVNDDVAAFGAILQTQLTQAIAADATIQALAPGDFVVQGVVPAVFEVRIVKSTGEVVETVVYREVVVNVTNVTNMTEMEEDWANITNVTNISVAEVVAPNVSTNVSNFTFLLDDDDDVLFPHWTNITNATTSTTTTTSSTTTTTTTVVCTIPSLSAESAQWVVTGSSSCMTGQTKSIGSKCEAECQPGTFNTAGTGALRVVSECAQPAGSGGPAFYVDTTNTSLPLSSKLFCATKVCPGNVTQADHNCAELTGVNCPTHNLKCAGGCLGNWLLGADRSCRTGAQCQKLPAPSNSSQWYGDHHQVTVQHMCAHSAVLTHEVTCDLRCAFGYSGLPSRGTNGSTGSGVCWNGDHLYAVTK